ncbi:OPT oligopeptide transporter [Mycena galericulata]|nr:OPT oligopeptide transporter [Mycena galericulata]
MTALAQEPVLSRDPQVLVVDEKLLQEDDDVGKSDIASTSLEDADSQYDWDSEEFRGIPELVRSIVSFEDDPSLPERVIIALLHHPRKCRLANRLLPHTTATFSVFFVILVSDPMERIMARVLPDYTVPLGRFSFSLNGSPWSVKEYALIGTAANAGSQGQWATYLPTNAKLYYGIDYHPAVALFFGWGAALIGFAFAAMCRQILIYDPTYVFPLSLQQVTLYRSMEQNGKEGSGRAKRQMKVFWILFTATFLWQFMPEYVFPFTASLAPLCWFASRNHIANFLGSGIGGIGLLNITLDWSNITSTVITFPYSVQVIIFVSFVITTWILIPVAYFGNLWGSPTYNIMSNGLFTKNGSSYPFTTILSVVDGQQVFNEPIYNEVGLAYAGAQYMWEIFFWYASYVSAFVWFGIFVGPKLVKIYKARRERKSVHTDRLTKLIQASYRDITLYEWLALFTIPFVILLVVVIKGGIYMPLFTYFVGLAVGAAATLPMASIYALSGFMLKVGLFVSARIGLIIERLIQPTTFYNELIYGYMIDGVKGSSRHPLGQLACIPDYLGIAHYLHIPPRATIGIQIMAALVGLPVNYGVMRWILYTKYDYLTGVRHDPTGEWTAQDFKSYNTAGNTTIFFASGATFRGNISTGPLTSIIIGTVWNFWLFRYRNRFWKMWAYVFYISGAAMDTGFNATLLFMFVAFGSTGITMANWWGNNAQSTERCFHVKT